MSNYRVQVLRFPEGEHDEVFVAVLLHTKRRRWSGASRELVLRRQTVQDEAEGYAIGRTWLDALRSDPTGPGPLAPDRSEA